MTTLSSINIDKSSIVLANASELLNHILNEVVGNDVADSLTGVPITRDIINSLVQQRFRMSLLAAGNRGTSQSVSNIE
jgi:hypothetical protein